MGSSLEGRADARGAKEMQYEGDLKVEDRRDWCESQYVGSRKQKRKMIIIASRTEEQKLWPGGRGKLSTQFPRGPLGSFSRILCA